MTWGLCRTALAALSVLTCAPTRAEPVARAEMPQKEVAASPAPAHCPRAEPVTVRARLESGAIDELSGLVASRTQPGVFWVHNDSGDRPRVFAIDLRGRLLLELTLTNVEPIDVEDIALARGPGGKSYLYLADTGDNNHRRKKVLLYRLEEPNVVRARTAGEPPRRKAKTIEVRYEDGPHDVETLLVDPARGDLFLVAKGALFTSRQPVGVYRVAAADVERGQALARKVATIPVGPATAGDVLPDGSGIAIRNYTSLYYWARGSHESIAEALARTPCGLPLADLGQQGEALGFTADGAEYVTIAEGDHAAIYRFTLTKP